MPSLIDIRRRIRSVKNTQQITKAMKMVAAAKLRRAQERVIAARPYGNSLREMLANIAAAAQAAIDTGEANPLLATRPEQRVLLLVLTSDRGLAGAYSVNVIKAAQQFIASHRESQPGAQFEIEAIGRKGRDFFRRRAALAGEHVGVVDKAKYADAARIARPIIDRFAKGEIDAVYAIGNEFRSVVSQRVISTKLLPVEPPVDSEPRDYIIEGSAEEMLAALLPLYLESSILRLMLESAAAEHAARMTAMDAATSNASDVIERLTLNMNRIRQASITKEIIEVVSGAQAL
jgi:F-type H+-transporting ATPase subunit gamma